jgi:hypothetical protein
LSAESLPPLPAEGKSYESEAALRMLVQQKQAALRMLVQQKKLTSKNGVDTEGWNSMLVKTDFHAMVYS